MPSDKDPARRAAGDPHLRHHKAEVLALADWLRSWQVPGGPVTTVVIDFERLADEVARLRAIASKIAQAVTNPT